MNKCLLFLQAVLGLYCPALYCNHIVGDTVYTINEITVVGTRLKHFTPGNHIETLDSMILRSKPASNLGEILSQNTSIQINSYGLGGTTSASVRGSGSSQVAVLWNGFNLQDIINGGMNLVLVPTVFLDDVEIQYGGCSALFGSGAIGGAIHLDNPMSFNQGTSASAILSVGSFSNYFESAKMKASGPNYAGSFCFFNQTALNNFPYKNTSEYKQTIVRQINDKTTQYGVMTDHNFKINDKQKISFHLWYQDTYHQLPPNMAISSSDEKEDDKGERFTIDWSSESAERDYFVRSGLFNNYLYYDFPSSKIHSKYRSFSSVNEFETNQHIGPIFTINSGVNFTHEQAFSTNLVANAIRNREAFFSSLKASSNDLSWNAVASMREEVINNGFNPVTYSLGFDGEIFKGLSVKGCASKNYRVPTFDDLYYVTGGDSSLKNEYGWSEELGLNYELKPGSIKFDVGLTAFNNKVVNRIIWTPSETSSLWHPINIGRTWSRGLESNMGLAYQTVEFTLKASASYTLVYSTDETENSVTIHKQLIYVPKNKVAGNFQASYHGFSFIYTQQYVGKRYVSPENKEGSAYVVDPYSLADITVCQSFHFTKFELQVNGQVNNVWNATYQVMKSYPMPLRYYQIGIRINYQ
jgi:vitamin B12 transporter